MAARFLFLFACLAYLAQSEAGGHGGGHKKVVIHVPYKVHHHHHKHTIVKHIHHKAKGGGGGDDHYEVLGYTYGQPKAGGHGGHVGGHGWHAAEETQDYGHDSPVSFEGDHGYDAGASAGGADYGATGASDFAHGGGGGDEHGY